MKQRIRKILLACPLVLGTLSVFTFGLYYYSANHPPYRYIDDLPPHTRDFSRE